jgi:hypothetical protein
VKTLRMLLLSSRPLSWVNMAYPFAAAYLLTAREIDLAWVIGTLYFLVPYNLAMYGINDVFDYESDLRNPGNVRRHRAGSRRLHGDHLRGRRDNDGYDAFQSGAHGRHCRRMAAGCLHVHQRRNAFSAVS